MEIHMSQETKNIILSVHSFIVSDSLGKAFHYDQK